MRNAITRVAVAREIFTTEEIIQLYRYEFYLLWETAKQHVEWFLYAAVLAIWLGVGCLIVALAKSGMTEGEVVIRQEIVNVSQPLPKTEKEIRNQVREEIRKNKAKASAIDSNVIYTKVLAESNKWKLNTSLILAIIETECNFYENAKAADYDTTGSIGWSQATKKTWDWFNAQWVWPQYKTTYSYDDRYDIDKSLEFICWYVDFLRKSYPEKTKTYKEIYYCYNAGPNYKSVNKKMEANANRFMEAFNRYYLALNY